MPVSITFVKLSRALRGLYIYTYVLIFFFSFLEVVKLLFLEGKLDAMIIIVVYYECSPDVPILCSRLSHKETLSQSK